jgi:hypothetical protein
MADLKLPKLPDRTPVKIGIMVQPELASALADYLELYQATYDDNTATLVDLVPFMLLSFLESDRAFVKSRRAKLAADDAS